MSTGANNNKANGVDTVLWKRKDDNSKVHNVEVVKDILYFPEPPVNVLSVTKFADQLSDDHGTGCDTKRNYSILHWDNKSYHKTIEHPASNLPELIVNENCIRNTISDLNDMVSSDIY